MFSKEHMNIYTIFQSAQLLQRLCALQRAPFPFHKLQERVAPESVDALMATEDILSWKDCGGKGIARGKNKVRGRYDRQRP